MLFDVTSTSSLGRTARLAGKEDIAGNVTASFDLDDPFYKDPAPNLRPGGSGLMLFYVNRAITKFFQVPCIIEKVHWESAIEQEARYNFDVKENTLAGAFIYPII